MYTAQPLTIPESLSGISITTMKEHYGLYEGYVKNTNTILELLADSSIHASARMELQRRFSFEFNGMKNHEYYFETLAGGTADLPTDSLFEKYVSQEWGSFDTWKEIFTKVALTRGIGWAMVCYDAQADRLLHTWVDEQHLGQLSTCTPILSIDMWEHAFVADYLPSGKSKYVADFMNQIHWPTVEARMKKSVAGK